MANRPGYGSALLVSKETHKHEHTHNWQLKWLFVFWFMCALTFCGEPDLHDALVDRVTYVAPLL